MAERRICARNGGMGDAVFHLIWAGVCSLCVPFSSDSFYAPTCTAHANHAFFILLS